MRKLILILAIAVSLNSYGQKQDSIELDSIKVYSYFEWKEKQEYIQIKENINITYLKSQEKKRDTLLLKKFINANYDIVKLYDDFSFLPNSLVEYIYAIDFNGDGLLDIFYEGPTGSQQLIIQIFLNTGNSYKKVFSGYQNIIKMEMRDNKLSSFTLYNPGCCADPEIVESKYSINYSAAIPKFNLDNTIGYMSWTEMVKNKFSKEQEFSIINDTAILRNETYILTTRHPVWQSKGNEIAKYKKGRKGIAYGSKKENSRIWIYVLMASTIDKCEWPTFIANPTEMYGWILKEDTDLK